MKKILVCQHVAYEILGTLNPLLKNRGFRIQYVNFGRHPEQQPAIDKYHALIILGGPMNVDETKRYPHLAYEIKMIEQAMKLNIPVLGICLGAQLIARALGAKVSKNPQAEIGWYDINKTKLGEEEHVFKHFSANEKIFEWHSDTFEIPNGAAHLASSPTCDSQAFCYGENIYGFQFHLEVDQAMIERWMKLPNHSKELLNLKGSTGCAEIRRGNQAYLERLIQLSELTFSELLNIFTQQHIKSTES